MKRLFSVMVLAMLVLLAAPSSYAVTIVFTADLDAASENPPNPSLGTGEAVVVFDSVAHTLSVSASFSGLTGTTTVAHIHCCIAPPGNVGVATTTPTFPGFPAGVTSGIYMMTFDTSLASTYNPAFLNNAVNMGDVAIAEQTLFNGALAGEAYFNIHTSFRPGGEIRGFLQAVPEPGTFGLLATGVVALGVAVRRRRR